MKILVTGATGFIGSVLIPLLCQRVGPEAITAFVLPEEKIPASWEKEKVRILRGDISDRQAVADACRGTSHVLHLAGLISYWKRDLPKLLQVNRDGVVHVVEACLEHGIQRLVHISSVGALGFFRNGSLADEETPFNWPTSFYYMVTKRLGQEIVEKAVQEKKLPAVILNPASIMGPGDPNLHTPHNQLYWRIYKGVLRGSFSGGLAVVDVRDLVSAIFAAMDQGQIGEKYLIVGANPSYCEVVRQIGSNAGRPVYPFPIPAVIFTAAGLLMESVSRLTGKRPLLTYAYGRLSGWKTYYSNEKSKKELGLNYTDLDTTIRDSCRYFEKTFLPDFCKEEKVVL